jgi:hypothetical protein
LDPSELKRLGTDATVPGEHQNELLENRISSGKAGMINKETRRAGELWSKNMNPLSPLPRPSSKEGFLISLIDPGSIICM